MRKLVVIPCTVAFVTFSLGVIIATIFRTSLTNVSKQPASHFDQFFVETKPQELLPAEPDTTAPQHSDLSIVIESSEPNPDRPSLRRRYIKLVHRGPTVIDLDLGESIDNQEVTLNLRGNDEHRMFQRYRTSVTISAEGPHLDLVNWRHFDSPWTQLKSLSFKRFRTLATNQMDASRFPSATNEEIVKEVRMHVGTDWPNTLELVRDCNGPNNGACLVAISSIYLRLQKRMRVGWIDVGLIEIKVPMGC